MKVTIDLKGIIADSYLSPKGRSSGALYLKTHPHLADSRLDAVAKKAQGAVTNFRIKTP